jgi:hypothetical protein
MSSSYNLLEEVKEFQDSYYSQNTKNLFLKNSQKLECAKDITKNFNIFDLIKKTIYIIPNTNKVYIDYLIYKLYANPNVYNNIVNYTFNIFSECISKYGDFECHINLNTFTITSAYRYNDMIELFCKKCLTTSNPSYSMLLSKFYIYNSPAMMENISKIFSHLINLEVKSKLIIYNKQETIVKLEELFTPLTI